MRFCSLILFTILLGCKPKAHREGDKLLFQIEKKESSTKISTFDKSNHLLSSVDFYKIPQRIVIFSSSHAGFLNELGLLKHVIAVSNKNYFYNTQISENESIISLGDYQSINFEKLVKLKPDLLLLNSEVSSHFDFIKKLKLFKIPFLICNEYEEPNVIHQAKWLKMYGALFNQDAKADSILQIIETKYTELSKPKSSTKNLTLTGLPWQNQWYVSCSKNLFNQLLHDAGGTLFIEKDCEENSAVLFEDILIHGRNADFWIHTGTASSFNEIESSFPYAKEIKAFRTQKCFNNNARVASNQANDYWERGPVRPDLIIKDLFQIYSDSTFSKGYFYKKIVE
jgi:iron complex transport system substrate-binding protein